MLGLEPADLYERELETAHLQRAVDHSWHGAGRLVVVEGPAGIGKTALLDRAGQLARESGMHLRSARGGELEQSFPFGVVRQLFEAMLEGASEAELRTWLAGAAELAAPLFDHQTLLELPQESIYPRLHGLYWLSSNIGADRPVALLVDDAQAADEPSLAFLSFLALRLAELPVLLVVSVRTSDAQPPKALATLRRDPGARVLALRGLSVAGVERMLREHLDQTVDERFAVACFEATAGNPFLLTELTKELRTAQIDPTAGNAKRLGALVPRRVTESVMSRIRSASGAALPLAQALAVLGDAAALEQAAALAGIDEASALHAAMAMREDGVLGGETDLGFSHPIIRTAIYRDILPDQRRLLHARAAGLIREAGAGHQHVAAQILLADGFNEPWVLEQLLLAADSALAMGAPGSAVPYLSRALELASPETERARVLALLGHAEALAGRPEATQHLEEAVRLTADTNERARVAVMLFELLRFTGRCPRVVELASALPPAPDPSLNELLNNELLMTTVMSNSAKQSLVERLSQLRDPGGAATSETESLHLILLAFQAMLDGGPQHIVTDLLNRAAPRPLPRERRIMLSPGIVTAAHTYNFCDELGAAHTLIDPIVRQCERRGARVSMVITLGVRGETAYRQGRLADAQADAEQSWQLSAELSPDMEPLCLVPLAVLGSVAVERDCPDTELEALLRDTERLIDMDNLQVGLTLAARARLLLALGRTQLALDQLLEFASLPGTFGGGAPGAVPWRSMAALILLQLGDGEQARALAETELELATRMGGLRALGLAMRACALVSSPVAVEQLSQAAQALDRAGAQLEHARALIDLGAAMRRSGERSSAREPLRDGHDKALRCGAPRLAARARQELAASGERISSGALSGVASLTPSERRVADMAASGSSNREIAQNLFVTEKTVEAHLSHVYDKLGVRSRHKLAGVLTQDVGPTLSSAD